MKKIKTLKYLLGIGALSALAIVPTSIAMVSCGGSSSDEIVLSDTIEESNINNLKQALLGITIDNYKEYFDGADYSPNELNSGRMSVEKLSKIMRVQPSLLNSITFVKSATESENGMLNVDININLSENTLFNNENIISLTDVRTGMFDPNSAYNLEMFTIDANSHCLNGLDKSLIESRIGENGTLYIPWSVTTGRKNCWKDSMGTTQIDTLDLSYSQFNPTYNSAGDSIFGIMRVNNVVNHSPLFKYAQGANSDTNNNYTGYLFTDSFYQIIDFSNSGIYATYRGMFSRNTSVVPTPTLTTVSFANCTNLSIIGRNTFSNQSALTTIDFRGCPITQVASYAFNGCTNLQTIYVKDATAKSAIETALNAAHISGVNVIIQSVVK